MIDDMITTAHTVYHTGSNLFGNVGTISLPPSLSQSSANADGFPLSERYTRAFIPSYWEPVSLAHSFITISIMHYTLLLAAAVLTHTHAHADDFAHGRIHRKRSMDTKIVWDYVTVTEYVTPDATPGAPLHWHPSWSPGSWVSSGESSAIFRHSSHNEVAPISQRSSSRATSAPATKVSSPVAYISPSAGSRSSTASSSSPASSSQGASTSGISRGTLSPNGKKAGLSGYPGIQAMPAFSDLASYISWYSDYTPNTPDSQGVMGIGMLWGASGSPCGSVKTERLAIFNEMMSNNTVPSIMFGFYEPDCDCWMSSQMSTSSAALDWESLIAPLAQKGTILGSPSMCKQYNEDFLTPFRSAISTDWEVTSIHINKPNVSEAQKDVEYYSSTYGKKIWVSEFACVHDQPSWEPCTDQDEINNFINDVVSYFESNDDVVAYGPSNGAGLGEVWPLTDSNGALTTSGQTYLSAIKNL